MYPVQCWVSTPRDNPGADPYSTGLIVPPPYARTTPYSPWYSLRVYPRTSCRVGPPVHIPYRVPHGTAVPVQPLAPAGGPTPMDNMKDRGHEVRGLYPEYRKVRIPGRYR